MLALYSGAAAEVGHLGLSVAAALSALLVAAWVAVTLVPVLAKRTPLRWIGYKMEYRITREGWMYIGGIIIVALAALNTGNNLLFLILASLIAIILMSGILVFHHAERRRPSPRIAGAHFRRPNRPRPRRTREREVNAAVVFSARRRRER